MGIAIHNLSATEDEPVESMNLSAGVRQNATGLLGTTVQLSDLVCRRLMQDLHSFLLIRCSIRSSHSLREVLCTSAR